MPHRGKIFPLLEPIFFPITAAAVLAKWPICLSGRGVHGRLVGVIGTAGKNVGVCIDADALSIDMERTGEGIKCLFTSARIRKLELIFISTLASALRKDKIYSTFK